MKQTNKADQADFSTSSTTVLMESEANLHSQNMLSGQGGTTQASSQLGTNDDIVMTEEE